MFFLPKNCILLSKSIKILNICTFFHHATHTKIYCIEYQVISRQRRGRYIPHGRTSEYSGILTKTHFWTKIAPESKLSRDLFANVQFLL